MGKLLEDVQTYLSSATKEQLQKDWDELKDYNEIGPSMIYLIENTYNLDILYAEANSEIQMLDENEPYNNPQYNLAA